MDRIVDQGGVVIIAPTAVALQRRALAQMLPGLFPEEAPRAWQTADDVRAAAEDGTGGYVRRATVIRRGNRGRRVMKKAPAA